MAKAFINVVIKQDCFLSLNSKYNVEDGDRKLDDVDDDDENNEKKGEQQLIDTL